MEQNGDKKKDNIDIDDNVISDFIGSEIPKKNVVIQIDDDIEIQFNKPVEMTVYWIERFSTIHLYKAKIVPIPAGARTTPPPLNVDGQDRNFVRENEAAMITKFLRSANMNPKDFLLPAYTAGSVWFYVKEKREMANDILEYFINSKLKNVTKQPSQCK